MRRGTGNKEIFRLMEMNNKMKQLPNSLESPFLDQEVLTAEPRQESGPGITRLAEEGPFEKDSIQSNETDLAAFTQEADPGHWVSENERLWDTEDEDAHEYRAEMYEDMGEVAPAAWSLRVIDESGKAIDGEAYAVYQEGAKANGTLTVGRANMGRIDPGKPFRFELKGRACAIQAGALLVTEAPSVEYGGTAVDWQEADAANADTRFWRDYEAYRTSTVDAPASFWQHEHITRRLIRLRKKWAEKRSAMPAVIVAAPVKVRVGPFVRYTNANTAVIWVETHTPALVRVRFGKAAAGSPLSERHAATVRVGGRHFALVALEGLAEATRYKYTLELAPLPAKMGIPTDEAALASAFPKLPAPVLADVRKQLRAASYDGTEWLTFSTLRTRYASGLRFAYGSCRKWPFDRAGSETSGPDALEAFSGLLGKQDRDKQWPRFMLFVGDQIYADDIGHLQGMAIGRARWGRRIPDPKNDGAWAGRFASRFTGVTNAPRNQRYRIDNHLLWNIPFDAANLPKEAYKATPAGDTKLPASPEVPPHGGPMPMHAADFTEYAYLYEAAWGRRDPVRKVLANVPSFMIFDDHEITDDWNFDQAWLDLAHRGSVLEHWPEALADGLIAYWMYQGWGNLPPAQWSDDKRVALLLSHLATGTDALASLRKLLRRDLEPPAKTLSWDYALPMESPIFYVVDCRMTRRLVPSKGPAFDDRVLDPAAMDKMRKLFALSTAPVAFMVSSLPVLLPALIADGFRLEKVTASFLGIKPLSLTPLRMNEELRRRRDMEHWVANRSWFDVMQLLTDLSRDAPHLKALVALSGDVHFSYNMLGRVDPSQKIPKEMKLKPARMDNKGHAIPYLLQLVSSGMKQKLTPMDEYGVQLLVEDESLLKGKSFDNKNIKKLEELRRGTAIANGLYDKKYVRDHYDFHGMKLRLGGFDGIDDPRRTLMTENSVAVVDLSVEKDGAHFKLVERYVTRDAPPRTQFAFQWARKGWSLTKPRFA